MIDNLTDAITHAREVAKDRNETANNTPTVYGDYINSCRECAKEHEQLASWLTELQERRETDDISYEGMTVSEALQDLENCVLPVVGGKSIRVAIRALKAICERRKPSESEADK